MKIAFHGAARTVTGSKHLLTLVNGKKYLLDCGMFISIKKLKSVIESSKLAHISLQYKHGGEQV